MAPPVHNWTQFWPHWLTPWVALAAVAIGAVMGRALLGWTPTLLAGVIGLATLLAWLAVAETLPWAHAETSQGANAGKAAAMWLHSTVSVGTTYRKRGVDVIDVRYEDFVADPAATLRASSTTS
mgnify:CR=1 FL=1